MTTRTDTRLQRVISRHGGRMNVFTKRLVSEISINASAEQVWAILADFPAYSQWNPFIREICGQPIVGEKIKITIEPPGFGKLSYKPVIQTAEPGKKLLWLGRTGLPNMLDGWHSFVIESDPTDGRGPVRFIHSETLTGILLFLTPRRLLDGFHLMNAALKERVERAAHGQGNRDAPQ